MTSQGGRANAGEMQMQAISADGRFVVFVGEPTNLVTGDTNGVQDVFVRDRSLKTTEA